MVRSHSSRFESLRKKLILLEKLSVAAGAQCFSATSLSFRLTECADMDFL